MKRASLTPRERDEMFDRQGGICFCGCGQPLGKRFVAEHWTPVAIGNEEKPDCLMLPACADIKTYGGPGRVGGDIRDIYHVKRIAEGRTQYDVRKREGSQIKSRGFDKSLRKKMDGSVVRNG